MLWVELSEHCSYTAALMNKAGMNIRNYTDEQHLYGLVAAGTEAASEGVVVSLTVGEALVLIKLA